MKSWNNALSKVVMLLVVAVTFFSFQSSTFAAAVGQALTEPEQGWVRYDDNNENILYVGSGWIKENKTENYKTTAHYTPDVGNYYSFSFYGTKFRLITAVNSTHSKNIEVSIDGKTTLYSEYTNPPIIRSALGFESAELPLGVHKVVVTNKATGFLAQDAIDVFNNGYLVNTKLPQPTNLTATGGIENVELSWASVTSATSYNVKRSATTGGPYEIIATSVTGDTYTDVNVIPGIEYFYVVTAVNSAGESIASNEASAIPVGLPDTGRAILTIYLTNGAEKEYDLSMTEVNSFIDWYDQKDAGAGPAKYAFIKTWNKGPFTKRTEYIVFDKILTFNVDEYAAEE